MRATEDWLRAYEAKHRGKHAPTLKPSKAVEREADLHAQIEDYCRRMGWLYFHGSMAHRTKRTPGEPDFIILAPGKFFLIECKTGTGKLSKEQMATIAHAEKMGFRVHVVRNLEEFLEVVR